ncbi:MAG: DUF1820 family protein [Gammaproteobacteria bacterium]|nr:DUF1820 family protein [Gammaproteobacteria bacterium]
MSSQRLYRVSFLYQGQVYEIYARAVSHGALLGFVEVEKLVFGERSTVVVDPSEERLKSEFADVERTFIPVHAVLRIDQVDKAGAARAVAASGESAKVMPFPVFGSGGGEHKK